MNNRPNHAQHDRAAHGGDGQAPLVDPFDTDEPDAEAVIEYQDGDDLVLRSSAEAESFDAHEADQAHRTVPGGSRPAGAIETDPIDPSGRGQSGYYEGTVATGGIRGPAGGSSDAPESDSDASTELINSSIAGHHDRGDLDDHVGSFNAEPPAGADPAGPVRQRGAFDDTAGSESVRFDGSDVGLGGSVAAGYVDQASPELALTDVGDANGDHGADGFFEAWPPQVDETVQPDDDAFTATDDLWL